MSSSNIVKCELRTPVIIVAACVVFCVISNAVTAVNPLHNRIIRKVSGPNVLVFVSYGLNSDGALFAMSRWLLV
ncbi:hypothetical protein NPIL_233731 [Nephila pilipes]|uniref:Uncharacterized protein n=1 Tax=Nephila pilipes TaxID=299642 RepID=A0A8X6U5M4_NEPPI|nr:hypothetical protein NPIL_233731 [Nephila pilipes]